MGLLDRLTARYGHTDPSLEFIADSQGLGFSFAEADWKGLSAGAGSRLAQHQYVTMQLLLEQGLAEQIRRGFYMNAADVVRLDPTTRDTLLLPEPWPGAMLASTYGETRKPDYQIQLALIGTDGQRITNYRMEGPILVVSAQERFLPDAAQWQAIASVEQHSAIESEKRDEYVNLRAVHGLLDAQAQGADVRIVGFDELELVSPSDVTVSVTDRENGDLILTPSFGVPIDPNMINERLGQLGASPETGSLRIGNQIVLLDAPRMQAVQEVVASRRISRKDRTRFLENPTAWLNASLVDLDLGFSFRVRGAGPLRHAYFGETDDSGTGWFESTPPGGKAPQEPIPVATGAIPGLIRNRDDLIRLEQRIGDAIAAGADTVAFKDKLIDISDPAAVRKAMESAADDLQSGPEPDAAEPEDATGDPAVLDIKEYDETLDDVLFSIEPPPPHLRSSADVDFRDYKRTPYPHQEDGIRWLLAVAQEHWCEGIDRVPHRGAMLADDMGLGKTYMSLVFLKEYLATQPEASGPVLPL